MGGAASYLLAGLLTAALVQAVGQSRLDNARRALESGHNSEAEAELKDILQNDPKSVEANLMLAAVELSRGDIGQAIALYRNVLKINPKSSSAHYGLGMTYLRAHQVDAGLAELRSAATLEPSQPDIAYNLGVALLDAGQPRKALAYLQRAKALGPNRPDLAFNLIRAEVAAGSMNTALHEAQEDATLFSEDANWNASVGHLLVKAGEPKEAIGYLSSALHLDPGNADLRHELAGAYLANHHPELALELISNPASAEDHYLRGRAYFSQQHMQEAEQESSRCLELEPEQPRCLLLGARIAQSLGQHESALRLLDNASKQVPDWPDPYYSAAVSYYFERRYAEARQSLDRALKLDPRSARSLFLYGVTLVNEGKDREAEDYLRRAIAKEPNNARFRFHLGAALLRDNQPVEAQKEFEKSIQLRSDYGPPHYQLGKLLVDRNPVTARLELEDAVRCDRTLAQAYYQLSRVYVKLGQKDKAERALASFNSLKKVETETRQEDDVSNEMKKELQP
jgi:Tfp pilus assembly protein PilF